LLDQRYRLDEVLGQGPQGTTCLAVAVADGSRVVVKELRVQAHLADKRRELFSREAQVLRQLDHPAIPRYVDDFEVRSGRWRTLCLVQAYIDGASLAAESVDHRYEQEEVLEIAAALLEILAYLHELSPPVVHRDIKPSNIIRRRDGGLSLVDFGSVRDALKDPDLGGSTVAGTFGYMAPEQFAGDASPQTDLYGVGALAVALLTRREPHTLLDLRNRMDWEVHAQPHPALALVLHRLLAPDPEGRPESARAALTEVKWAQDEMRANPETAALVRAPPQELAPSTPLVMGGALLLILAVIAALLMASLPAVHGPLHDPPDAHDSLQVDQYVIDAREQVLYSSAGWLQECVRQAPTPTGKHEVHVVLPVDQHGAVTSPHYRTLYANPAMRRCLETRLSQLRFLPPDTLPEEVWFTWTWEGLESASPEEVASYNLRARSAIVEPAIPWLQECVTHDIRDATELNFVQAWLEIDPSGAVREVEVRATHYSDDMLECLRHRMEHLQFPPPGGEPPEVWFRWVMR
jgi:hypothetical protein